MKSQQRNFDLEREQASVRMFTNSRDWPHLILPVKNYKMKSEKSHLGALGIIATPAAEKLPLVIYETNMWAPDFDNSRKHVYASVQEAVSAGWIVD